jgi:hypothetical protein
MGLPTEGDKSYEEVHSHSDVDSGAFAIHHTLGPLPEQAAPGNHHGKWTELPVVFKCGGAVVTLRSDSYFQYRVNGDILDYQFILIANSTHAAGALTVESMPRASVQVKPGITNYVGTSNYQRTGGGSRAAYQYMTPGSRVLQFGDHAAGQLIVPLDPNNWVTGQGWIR